MKNEAQEPTRNNRLIYLMFVLLLACCIGIPSLAGIRLGRPNWFNKPPKWESKWLENPTCEPPCWENIIPGMTSREEVKSILEVNPATMDIEEREVIPYSTTIFVKIKDARYPGNATIYFDKADTVQIIELRLEEGGINPYDVGSYPGAGLYLDDLTPAFGFPKQVLLIHWDYGYTKSTLLYSDIFMLVELAGYALGQNGISANIQNYSEVSRIYLIGSDLEFPEFLEIAYSSGSYEWKGYGSYP